MKANTRALNINEAADFLGVHPQTVRKLARKGALPSFKVGRAWRFRQDALQTWIDSHHERSKATSPLVLVVDDEKSIRVTVGYSLEKAGYRVRTVASGNDAIAVLKEQIPGCIILDLNMPKGSGVDVLREMDATGRHSPVIVLTGYPDSDLIQEALQFAPLLVMAKPAKPVDILNAVKKAIQP